MHNHRYAILHHSYMRQDMHGLQTSNILRSLGISMLELFQPLYLLQNGLDYQTLMLFYIAQWTAATIIALLTSTISAKLGLARSMLLGLFAFALYLILFTLGPATNFATIWLAAIPFGLYQSIYWPNFHHYLANLSHDSSRGSATGMIFFAVAFTRFIAPLAGGLIIAALGYPAIFVIAIGTILASVYPFFQSNTRQALVSEPPRQIIKDTMSRQHWLHHLIFANAGLTWFVNNVIWSIFIFSILGTVAQMGLFTTIAAVLSAAVTYAFAKNIDRYPHEKTLVAGSGVLGLGWILRSLVLNKTTFIFADCVARLGDNLFQIPFFAFSYDLQEHQDPTSFQSQRIMFVSLGFLLAATLAYTIGENHLRWLIALAALCSFLLALTPKTIRHTRPNKEQS